MQISLKQLFLLVGLVAALGVLATWLMQSRAPDLWGYGKFGVSAGTAQSPIYFVEVRGVGKQPTIARIVRFPNHAATPQNALEVSHAVSSEFDSHVQNADRWNDELILIAGRTNDEKIPIRIDGTTARKLFAKPGARFKNARNCDAFWEEYVSPHLPDKI